MGDGDVGKKRILILATDSVEWGRGISSELDRLGYEAVVADGPNFAWHALLDGAYDAIIVEAVDDLAEGCLITRMLRDRWSMPIIVLSDSRNAQDRINCYEAGADLYLTAPVDMPELVARLGSLLRRAEITAELQRRFGQEKPDYTRTWLSRG